MLSNSTDTYNMTKYGFIYPNFNLFTVRYVRSLWNRVFSHASHTYPRTRSVLTVPCPQAVSSVAVVRTPTYCGTRLVSQAAITPA